MKKIISEKLPRITKNKKQLGKELKVKITNRGKEVFIEGKPEDEYIAEKVIEALNFGFPFSAAILIKKEGYTFEILNIKDYTRRKDLEKVRARLIGKKGKTLKTLSDLTECFFELKDNEIGVIGAPEKIKNAQDAIMQIAQGSKQGNVYKFLEKNKFKEPIDLGLK
jgi:ribosomal RNA assembly protein